MTSARSIGVSASCLALVLLAGPAGAASEPVPPLEPDFLEVSAAAGWADPEAGVGDFHVRGGLGSPIWRGFGWALAGDGGTGRRAGGESESRIRTRLFVTWDAIQAGAWSTAGVSRALDPGDGAGRWSEGTGVWVRIGRLTLDGGLDRARERIEERVLRYAPVMDTTITPPAPILAFRERDVATTTIRAAGRLGFDRVDLESAWEVARTSNERARGRGLVSASYWLTDGVALDVGARIGGGTATLEDTYLAGNRLSVGVRYAPFRRGRTAPDRQRAAAVTRWEVRSDSAGSYRLLVHAPGASRVEMMGDVTDWSPISFDRLGTGLWSLGIRTSPGPHQVLVRRDGGAWESLPGAASQVDGYLGRVSVVLFE